MTGTRTETDVSIRQADAEFLELVASNTGYSTEDILEYSVDILQLLLDWKESLTPSEDMDLESLEDEPIEALSLALKIVNVGGVRRIILEGKGRDRWAIVPDPDSILSPKKKIWRRR